jgi:hypothetical protein
VVAAAAAHDGKVQEFDDAHNHLMAYTAHLSEAIHRIAI